MRPDTRQDFVPKYRSGDGFGTAASKPESTEVGWGSDRSQPQSLTEPDAYWERAGTRGYARMMFSSALVERCVNRRLWTVAMSIAEDLGVPADGRVLELGCGDGAFAVAALAPHFRQVDAYDKARTAIERAMASAPVPNLHFTATDLTTLDYAALPRYDAAFAMGFFHHVKARTPDIVDGIARITEKVIVLEPNGDNLIRKALEFTPGYRAAGEDSFTTQELRHIFERSGFRTAVWRRLNLFPNFTPAVAYRLLAPMQEWIESSAVLRALCTVNMFGFTSAGGGRTPA